MFSTIDAVASINSIKKMYENKQITSLIPLLPLLSLKGKPYDLTTFFPNEPMFKITVPRNTVLKCGRQVAKSTSMAANSIIQSVSTAYFNTLTVHPRFNQARQFSNNVVRPFIERSPVKVLMMDSTCENSVQQRSFRNLSNMYFSFAFLDAERCRGISCDKLNFDEVQDLDVSFIPVIKEAMSASNYKITQYSGTPKSFDNPMEVIWGESSQGVWVTKCLRCNYNNHACLEGDILKMIGLKTVVCAKCDRPINPATGHYEHTFPDRINFFEGYHIPQIIMPMHYALEIEWKALLKKMADYSKTKFYNECLGISSDDGHKLVSVTELKAASVLTHNNELEQARLTRGRYYDVAMGIDWGGGGISGVSTTTVAIVGKIPGETSLHVIYMERMRQNTSDDDQALRVKQLARIFDCSIIAHDFGGAGSVRETLLIHSGIPVSALVPIAYVRIRSGKILVHKPIDHINPRNYYSADKARSLTLICAYIKKMKIIFPRYESCIDLMRDFLALIAEATDSKYGSENYFVGKAANISDDMAHSVNFACMALWYRYNDFPILEEVEGLNKSIDPEEVNPPDKW